MIKTKFRHFLATVFPSKPSEVAVFFIFLLCYSVWAWFIASGFRIVYDERIPWDAYFSFDNRAIVLTGGGFERHPLSKYFFDVLRKAGLAISDGKKNEVFSIFLSLCSSMAVSFSVLYVYKYLRNILQLPLKISLALLAFFGTTTTCILLSFTPETYTYTLLFLSFFTYYSALKTRKGQEIPVTALAASAVITGGLTITNVVKVYLPVLYTKNLFRNGKVFLHTALYSVISFAVLVVLYLNRVNFDYHKIFTKTGEQYNKFSKPKDTALWDMIVSWFFGGNMAFSSLVVKDYHSSSGFKYKALFMDVYSGWLPYLFCGIIFTLLIFSIIKNRKEKLVQLLALSFLCDVIIHCMMKFGLYTSYIYGGHFVFVFPLLIGWLFSAYRGNAEILTVLYCVFCFAVGFQIINNFYRIQEFLYFLDAYYR